MWLPSQRKYLEDILKTSETRYSRYLHNKKRETPSLPQEMEKENVSKINQIKQKQENILQLSSKERTNPSAF